MLTMAFLLLAGFSAAQESGDDFDISNPKEMECSESGIEGLLCGIMQSLLRIGPIIAVISLIVAGITYIYASIFVTADQRGRYQTLATSLAIGAIVLAALVGGAGYIVNTGEGLIGGSG